MSHKHRNLLRSIFHDPVSGNIHWREVESLLNHLDASLTSHSGTKVHVVLNGVEGVLHRPHHTNVLNRQHIMHLREYLARAKVTPALYEASE